MSWKTLVTFYLQKNDNEGHHQIHQFKIKDFVKITTCNNIGNEPSNDLSGRPVAQQKRDLLLSLQPFWRTGQTLEEKPTVLPFLAVFQSVHKPSFQTQNGVKDKLLKCRVYNSSQGRLCKARFLKAAHLGTLEEFHACFHLSAPQKSTDNAVVQGLHSRLSCPHFPDSFATAFGDADFHLYGHKQDTMCVTVLIK